MRCNFHDKRKDNPKIIHTAKYIYNAFSVDRIPFFIVTYKYIRLQNTINDTKNAIEFSVVIYTIL